MAQPEIEVIRPIRPDEAMDQLGVKKDAFYDRLKYLGIRLDKDDDGKTFLTPEQFGQMESLGQHIRETGKKEGFLDGNSALAVNRDAGLAGVRVEVGEIPIEEPLEDLMQQAGQLAAYRLTAPIQVVKAIADQMTYEDLPQNLKVAVDEARASVNQPPKFQAQSIASDLLSQWRQQQAEATEAAV